MMMTLIAMRPTTMSGGLVLGRTVIRIHMDYRKCRLGFLCVQHARDDPRLLQALDSPV